MKKNIANDMKIYQTINKIDNLDNFLSNRYYNLTATTALTTVANILIQFKYHLFYSPLILSIIAIIEGAVIGNIMELIVSNIQDNNNKKKNTIIDNLKRNGIILNDESFDNYYQIVTEVITDTPEEYFSEENMNQIKHKNKKKNIKITLYDILTFDANKDFIIIRESIPKHIKNVKQTEVIFIENDSEEETKKIYRINHNK